MAKLPMTCRLLGRLTSLLIIRGLAKAVLSVSASVSLVSYWVRANLVLSVCVRVRVPLVVLVSSMSAEGLRCLESVKERILPVWLTNRVRKAVREALI